MKPGKTVTYVRASKPHDAEVLVVSGSGESGYKVLTLSVGGKTVENVHHVRDATGNAYWTETRGEHAAPEREQKAVPSSRRARVPGGAGRATAGGADKEGISR